MIGGSFSAKLALKWVWKGGWEFVGVEGFLSRERENSRYKVQK